MADLSSQKVKFLRNKLPFGTYAEALSTIKTKLGSLTDGEIVLASYLKTEGEGEQAQTTVRTLLGIRRDIGEGDTRQTGYEIFDNEAANDAIKALDATVEGGSENEHVKVNIVETDGKLTSVTVTTSDIASAAWLGTKEDATTVDTAFGRIAKEVAERKAAIAALDVASTPVNGTNVHVTYKEEDGIVTVQSVAEDYATVTRTATTSQSSNPKNDASLTVADGEQLAIGSDIEKVAAYANDKVTEEMHRVDKKIADLRGDVTSDDGTFVTVQVKTTAGQVSDVIVTQDMQAVASAGASNTGLAEASDVKAYVDSKSAAASTTVAQKAGITVTPVTYNGEGQDGHIEYQVASNLIFAYNAAVPASEGQEAVPATITLKSALREGETQVTYGTVNVSDIIGNGVLDHSSYDSETGILSLFFKQADGTLKEEEIDLKAMLDLDDVVIGNNSKNYLSASTTQPEEGQFVLDTKMKMMKDASYTEGSVVTGLADAADVKKYVDTKASDLAVKAQGDEYITAAVDASDNKKINVTADVQHVTGSKGTAGSYDAEGAQTTAPTHGTLTGVANALVDSAQSMAKVKDYVDGEVAIEAARADAKVLASIKALDKNDSAVAKSFVTAVSESDGVITVSRGTVTSTTQTVTLADNVDGGINLGVNVDDASIKISNVDGHVGQLTVGTIDCGTY